MSERDDNIEQGHTVPTFRETVDEWRKDAANHVLGVLLNEGYRPGNFTTRLIEVMLVADTENAARLRSIYPELMRAVHLYKNVENGLDVLRAEAKGQSYAP